MRCVTVATVTSVKCDGVRHLSAEPAASLHPSGDQQHLNKFSDTV